MTAGALRQALIAAEVAALRQRVDGMDLDQRPARCRDLLYRLQSGGEVRVPARLIRAALGVPVLELAAGYLLTTDDELVALDSQGTPRADHPNAAAA